MRRHRPWLILLLLVGLAACGRAANQPLFGLSLPPAMVVSVSEDGRYAVSSHKGKDLVLWDIEQRTHEVISDDANIYSAYFVRGRNVFLWQDLDDVVHVQHVDGEVLERFAHFPTYGHVMAPDLQTYVAADERWRLHVGHGANQQPLKTDGEHPGFLGIGKLLNLTLSSGDETLLSAGDGLRIRDELPIEGHSAIVPDDQFSDYAGVVLWNLDTREPVHKLPGNAAKTHATLSPDGRYVVAVDENIHHHVWDVVAGSAAYRMSRLGSGFATEDGFDASGVRIEFPDDFDSSHNRVMLAVRFLDNDYYAAFHTDEPYASLYKIGDPFAIKFLPLGEDPFPAVSSYTRNAAIASAPQANLLVTGQRSGGGINVYRFDAEAQTLERIWAPSP